MANQRLEGDLAELRDRQGFPVQLRPSGVVQIDATITAMTAGQKIVFRDSDPLANSKSAIVPVTLRSSAGGNVRLLTAGPCGVADAAGVVAASHAVEVLAANVEYKPMIFEVHKDDTAATGLTVYHDQPGQIFLEIV